MANYYKGAEIKFKLELEAEGFDMDRDDFKVDIVSGNTTISGDKWNDRATAISADDATKLAVIVFRYPELPDSSDSSASDSSGSSSSEDEEAGWYVIFNTSTLSVGDMKLVAWAYVPDGNADDLIRTDIAVTAIGRLVNP